MDKKFFINNQLRMIYLFLNKELKNSFLSLKF